MQHMINLPSVPIRKLRQAAAAEDLDVRTVARVVCGAAVRPICRERALRGLAAVGVDLATLPTPKPTKE